MENHGIKMVGDFKTDNIQSKTGTTSVVINDDGTFDLQKNFKVSNLSPSAGAVLRSSDANGNIEFALPSIPSNSVILFESDTVITGYTLLTDIDDELIYITKGSAASGDSGGSLKTSSTWTQPTHLHTTGDHTLIIAEIPNHDHTINNNEVAGAFGFSYGGVGSSLGPVTSTTSSVGGGGSHNHGNTGSSNTVNTWRPKGRNYTRQRRN